MPKLRSYGKQGDVIGYAFWCPGCHQVHQFAIKGPKSWTFDGNLEQPTFAPSLLVYEPRSDGHQTLCHLFVRNGVIEFLNDCKHELAGQKIPMEDFKWE